MHHLEAVIFFLSMSDTKCCLLRYSAPAHYFLQTDCQIVDTNAGRFKYLQSLSKCKCRYQMWVIFKGRCNKQELGISTRSVNPAEDKTSNSLFIVFFVVKCQIMRFCHRVLLHCSDITWSVLLLFSQPAEYV